MTYLACLKAAEAFCAERSVRHSQESQRCEVEEDKASSVTLALEALECALAIRRLAEAAERAAVVP